MIRYKKIPQNIYSKIDNLVEFLSANSEVVFAYLFGGLTKEKQYPLSDVDVALYVKEPERLDYLKLFLEITGILGTDEVDLIILNSAPVSLSGRILRNRKILVDKDPFLRHRYESLTLRMFFDFYVKEKEIIKRRYHIG